MNNTAVMLSPAAIMEARTHFRSLMASGRFVPRQPAWMPNHVWGMLRGCLCKMAFRSRKEAEANGQRGYHCPHCKEWHRTKQANWN